MCSDQRVWKRDIDAGDGNDRYGGSGKHAACEPDGMRRKHGGIHGSGYRNSADHVSVEERRNLYKWSNCFILAGKPDRQL